MTKSTSDHHLCRWTSELRARTDVVGGSYVERLAADDGSEFDAELATRYMATGGLDDSWTGPRPELRLYTLGDRSGAWWCKRLPYIDVDSERFIVASRCSGPYQPDWYANIRREPEVFVGVGADVYAAVAQVAPMTTRRIIWPEIVARHPAPAECGRDAEHEVLVRLVPQRSEITLTDPCVG